MVTIEMDDEEFKDLLWDRVNTFPPAQNCYPDWVWDYLFDDLEDMGWLKPEYNSPMYIVDNLAVNGEIKPYEEVETGYGLNGRTVEEFIEDEGGTIIESPYDDGEKYVILNYGL